MHSPKRPHRDGLCRRVLGTGHPRQGSVGRALVAPDLALGLGEHDDATGREHDVVVEVLRHRLIERPRLFIDRSRAVLQVVGADDRCVPPGVAAAKPALFNHRDIGDAVVFAKVVGSGEAMSARAHDDHIVFLFRLWSGPSPFPTSVLAECLAGDGEC